MLKRNPPTIAANRMRYAGKALRNGSRRMLCPMCNEIFQGESADIRYKSHWKDKHAKKNKET
jgi:hypothetical protein